MKKLSLIPLVVLIAFFLSSCDSTKSVVNNHYDDGIYYDPTATSETGQEPDDRGFSLGSIKDPERDLRDEQITTNPDADPNYVPDPNQQYYDNNGNVTVNNYYNTPTLRTPGWNTGLYWNNWGGWGVSVGAGWGWGGGFYNPYFYDPFFFDPWYNPYWYRPMGFYNPFRPWWGGWGYNSYWAGFYDGYYYGVNDGYFGGNNGRNRVYTGYVPVSARTNAYNSRSRTTIDKRSTTTREIDRNISRSRDISRTAATERRSSATTNRAADSRLTDANLRSRNQDIAMTTRNTAVDRSRDIPSGSSYDYVRSRASADAPARSNVRSSTTTRPDVNRSRSNTDVRTQDVQRNRATETPSNNRTYNRSNTRTRSMSRDQYFDNERSNRNYERSNTTPSRTNPAPQRRENNNNMYVPSQKRNQSYERSNTRSSTPSRSYTPSRSTTPSRNYTPSRSNSGSYTPSSSGSNRSYTPSSSPGRSYSSPSRGSSRSSTGGSRGRR